MRGIDVSHHQQAEDIDWARLKDEHQIEFCYIRASYGSRPDAEALVHAQYCEANEILYGFYHFFRHHQDPNAQLGAFTSVVERSDPELLPVLDLEANKYDPKVLDWTEYGSRAYGVGTQLSGDGDFVLYVSPSWYSQIDKGIVLGREDDYPWHHGPDLPLWIAHWDVQKPDSPRPYVLWQRGVKRFTGVPYDLDFNEGEPLRIEKEKPFHVSENTQAPFHVGQCLYVWSDGSLRPNQEPSE